MEGPVGSKKIISDRTMTFLFILTIIFTGCSGKDTNEWLQNLPQPWTLDEHQVSEILPKFHKRFPDFHQRLKAINLWRVGTPYGIFKLGEEIEPDPDPILRIDTSDCTVHVLTSIAFANSEDWEQTRNYMIDIHYKADGEGNKSPTFKSRWHYTSDRIRYNPYTRDLTLSLISRNSLDSIKIALNKKKDGSEFLDLDWSSERTVHFVPNEKIDKHFLYSLPEICGMAFVRRSYFGTGIVIAHEGVLIDRSNLIHASSEKKKTVNEDFMKYYFRDNGPVFDGLMIYEFVNI